MLDAFRDGEALLRRELDRLVLEIDQKAPLDHVKELVFFIVVVPVKFTLDDT